MAEFTPKKQEATSFNNGNQYRNGDAVQPEALNNLIEGVLYAQESGLTAEQEAKVEKIVINGNGDKFLADNGEYKEVSGGTTVTVNGEAVKTFNADTKLDKQIPTDTTSVPTIGTDGTQGLIEVQSGSALGNSLVKRGGNGEININTPASGGDLCATNKKYVHDLFNGANKAVSFVNYSSMITSLNALDNTAYRVGQNIMIVTLNVPDLWVSEVMAESATYEYVSDTDFTALLKTQGYVQVGYYKLSALETQKVDLTEYAKNEALEGKVDKFKGDNANRCLYGIAPDGSPLKIYLQSGITANRDWWVPVYNSTWGETEPTGEGRLISKDPIHPYQLSTKHYVDEKTALYQHQVTFKFYRISDNFVIDSGTLFILSKSATLIDNVDELRKYVGRVVFADCTAGKGVTIIEDNTGTLKVTIGEITAIIHDFLGTTEATTLEDSAIEL